MPIKDWNGRLSLQRSSCGATTAETQMRGPRRGSRYRAASPPALVKAEGRARPERIRMSQWAFRPGGQERQWAGDGQGHCRTRKL